MQYAGTLTLNHQTIIRALRRIKRRGDMGRAPKWARESIEFQGLARFGPPIPGVSEYNCYRLTERGEEYLRDA